jgi:CO/xanthine dehydrogenase FAD-binding subunit
VRAASGDEGEDPPVSARFERPASLAEALPLLARGGWAVLAGGTDVYPAHVGRPLSWPLLDITGIEGLRGLARSAGGAWSIGAATTWTDVLRADLPPLFDALKQAAREIGGVQIQNTGTIAGNLCNASPAADGIPGLLALDADIVLASAAGERIVPVAEFVQGNRRTLRRPDELVVELRLPKPCLSGPSMAARSIFLKLGARRYLVISIVMVAAVIEAEDGRVARCRLAVGACSAVARRLPDLEAALAGRPLSAALGRHVEPRHLAGLSPIGDVRGSAAYRADAAVTIVRRALDQVGAAA